MSSQLSPSSAKTTAEVSVKSAVFASPPMALFQGYNSVLGSGLSTAVEGQFTNTGGQSEVSCSVCMTTEELAKSLSIDQSLSVGFGPMGSVDQKLEFMSQLKVTTHSVSVTVYASHEIGSESITDVAFKKGIEIPTNNQQANEFVQYYGDSFVSRLASGGEYMAVYTFFSETREEQTSVVSSLKANGVFDGVTVGGSLQVAMSNFLKTTNVNYSFHQRITGHRNPQLPKPEEFIDFAVKFPSVPVDAPVIIGISSNGYENVPGAGSGFAKVRKNRLYFTGSGIQQGLTDSLVKITEAKNQMSWLAGVYEVYGNFNDEVLKANTKTATHDIDIIQTQMSEYATDPTADFQPPTLPSLQNGSPELSFDVMYSPQWGGSGGGPFDDVNINTYIRNKTRISSIGLRTGARTDQLRTTYASDNASDETKVHGGNGGGDQGTLQLLPGQFVTKVWGRSGSRVDQLHIQITGGNQIGGSGGGGGPYDWTPPAGAFVLGFAGRSGAEIDAIKVSYAKFNPAKWNK